MERMTDRKRLLDTAAEYVLRQRNKSYGEPDEDFQRIAAIANGMGFRFQHGDTIRTLSGSDVALFMIALKCARLAWAPTHEDSWTDIAGYAACGFETANLEEARRSNNELAAPALQEEDKSIVAAAGQTSIFSAQCGIACEEGHIYSGMCGLRIRDGRRELA